MINAMVRAGLDAGALDIAAGFAEGRTMAGLSAS
jgi:hypothetical protein